MPPCRTWPVRWTNNTDLYEVLQTTVSDLWPSDPIHGMSSPCCVQPPCLLCVFVSKVSWWLETVSEKLLFTVHLKTKLGKQQDVLSGSQSRPGGHIWHSKTGDNSLASLPVPIWPVPTWPVPTWPVLWWLFNCRSSSRPLPWILSGLVWLLTIRVPPGSGKEWTDNKLH